MNSSDQSREKLIDNFKEALFKLLASDLLSEEQKSEALKRCLVILKSTKN